MNSYKEEEGSSSLSWEVKVEASLCDCSHLPWAEQQDTGGWTYTATSTLSCILWVCISLWIIIKTFVNSHISMWYIFLSDNWCGRVYLFVNSVTPGQLVQITIRKQIGWAIENKSIKQHFSMAAIPVAAPKFLLEFPPWRRREEGTCHLTWRSPAWLQGVLKKEWHPRSEGKHA